MTSHFDVVVLGAGPGGYVAAIRAAQLGKKTAIIEKEYWGGVCLNVGCIPTKSLLRNAELANIVTREADTFGISGEVSVDYKKAFSRSRAVSKRMVNGIHFLMKKNKITEFNGWGEFTGPRTVVVKDDGGAVSEEITFDNCIIAAGSVVKTLRGTELSERVVTYKEQILSESVPPSIVIAGSGAIGTEFAYVLAAYGTKVTIVEFLDRIVPNEDKEISAELAKAYKKLGVSVLTSTKVDAIDDSGEKVKVTVSPAAGGQAQVLETDRVLQAVGFAPRTEGFGLEKTGVALTDRGAIAIDEYMRTNVPGIYAIGDCTAKLMLAHTAEAQGVVAAETIAGAETMPINYDMIPRATYCQPQIGSFGYTEAQAKEKGYDVTVSKFPFAANGKAWGLGDATGFVKIVADSRHGELLGASLIGPDVSELLPELTLAQLWDITAEEIGRNIHAHPSLSEALKDAAEGIGGHMINF
ncbi:dihydrolipoyl dehydrogenase [Acidipropionibacterium jensenii]|uniref:dihydrolipoyl dehydrogenase n=2 Tax=Acidipropionibacterium jensenii TaxID=1749 RepID=UPI0026480B48|nr:dihydrolipoyl dehydrogenase [Acidipropionibacterium jensenii]MDN5976243.1 dihydrolipoyl dehydrogenase [Acidipropionibacterium jensenii]MDN5996131.1 dihydrolipoyl dehydrogenase [Acidipropionibacterium jensenii]MDN6021689.1 dihydrolipoyl dehydrogenase [Acidipropionibacterium jensenii]MDN6427446.1 dihydrolipoyl dehydrogenase [Acidipropionibacterium jensenii]MDN6442056.1 dihydrolipoyl dehydrogenase [Acidipropionibacterium jensenii]